jgi:hypothetical protein
MSYDIEKHRLLRNLPKDLVDLAKEKHLLLMGGAITSVFTLKRINDFDFYLFDPTMKDDVVKFFNEHYKQAFSSDNALSYVDEENKNKYQVVIKPEFSGTCQAIFEMFDFTICMGGFDLRHNEFILHENFLKHNAQRILVFNHKTFYPMSSLIRVRKYLARDYTITNAEYLKLCLSIANLNIKTYGDLKKHIEGIDTLIFKPLTDAILLKKDQSCDLKDAIDEISKVLNDHYERSGVDAEF